MGRHWNISVEALHPVCDFRDSESYTLHRRIPGYGVRVMVMGILKTWSNSFVDSVIGAGARHVIRFEVPWT